MAQADIKTLVQNGLTQQELLQYSGNSDTATIGADGKIGNSDANISEVLTALGLQPNEAKELAVAFEGLTVAQVFDLINTDLDNANGTEDNGDQSAVSKNQENLTQGEARSLLGQIRAGAKIEGGDDALYNEYLGAEVFKWQTLEDGTRKTVGTPVTAGNELKYSYTDLTTGAPKEYSPSGEEIEAITTALNDGKLSPNEVDALLAGQGGAKYAALETVLRGLGLENDEILEMLTALQNGDLTAQELKTILTTEELTAADVDLSAERAGQQPGAVQPGQQPGAMQPGQQPGAVQPGQQPGAVQPGQQPGGSDRSNFMKAAEKEAYGGAFFNMRETLVDEQGKVSDQLLQSYLIQLGLQQNEAAFLAKELATEVNGITDQASFIESTGAAKAPLVDVNDPESMALLRVEALMTILGGDAYTNATGDTEMNNAKLAEAISPTAAGGAAPGGGAAAGATGAAGGAAGAAAPANGGLREDLANFKSDAPGNAEEGGTLLSKAYGVTQDSVLNEDEMTTYFQPDELGAVMAVQSSGDPENPNNYDKMRLLIESMIPNNVKYSTATIDQIMALGMQASPTGDGQVSIRNFLETIQNASGAALENDVGGAVLSAESLVKIADQNIVPSGGQQQGGTGLVAPEDNAAGTGPVRSGVVLAGGGGGANALAADDAAVAGPGVANPPGATAGVPTGAPGVEPGGETEAAAAIKTPDGKISRALLETMIAESVGDSVLESGRAASQQLADKIINLGLTAEEAVALINTNDDDIVVNELDNAAGGGGAGGPAGVLTELAEGKLSTESALKILQKEGGEELDAEAAKGFFRLLGMSKEQTDNMLTKIPETGMKAQELVALMDTNNDGKITADTGVSAEPNAPDTGERAKDGDLTIDIPDAPAPAGGQTGEAAAQQPAQASAKSFADIFGSAEPQISEADFIALIAPQTAAAEAGGVQEQPPGTENPASLSYDPLALKALLKMLGGGAAATGEGGAANGPAQVDAFVDALTAEQSGTAGAAGAAGATANPKIESGQIFRVLVADTEGETGAQGAQGTTLSGAKMANLADLTGGAEGDGLAEGEGEFKLGAEVGVSTRSAKEDIGSSGAGGAAGAGATGVGALEDGNITKNEFYNIFDMDGSTIPPTTQMTQSEAEDVLAQVLISMGYSRITAIAMAENLMQITGQANIADKLMKIFQAVTRKSSAGDGQQGTKNFNKSGMDALLADDAAMQALGDNAPPEEEAA